MTTLSLREVDLLSRAILTVNQATSFPEFGAAAFAALRGMIGYDAAGINRLDPHSRTVIGITDPTVDFVLSPEELHACIADFFRLPGVADGRYLAPGITGITRFQPLRTFMSSDFYQLLWRRMDLLQDQSAVYQGGQGEPAWLLTVLRGTQDFSDQERLMLGVLGEHVRQRHQQLRATAPAHPLFTLDRMARPQIWLLCSEDGRILNHHPDLPAWLRRLRVPFGATLPETWQHWLRQQLAPAHPTGPYRPLPVGNGAFGVLVHCVADVDRRAHRLVLEARETGITRLTPRERDVAHWLRTGKTNPEIAEILGVSQATVKNQVAAILEKLAVPNRTAAARMLTESDLPPP